MVRVYKHLKISEQTKEMWTNCTIESMACYIAQYYGSEYYNFCNKYKHGFINQKLKVPKDISGTSKTTHSLALCLARFLKPLGGNNYTDKTPWELFIEYVITELDSINYDYSQSLSKTEKK